MKYLLMVAMIFSFYSCDEDDAEKICRLCSLQKCEQMSDTARKLCRLCDVDCEKKSE